MTTLREYLRKEIGVQMFISDKMVNVELDRNIALRGQMVKSIITALSVPATSVQYPTDWWQAFKKRWFPHWLKVRFPVNYTVWTAARYCPHKAISEPRPHVDFLDTPAVFQEETT